MDCKFLNSILQDNYQLLHWNCSGDTIYVQGTINKVFKDKFSALKMHLVAV